RDVGVTARIDHHTVLSGGQETEERPVAAGGDRSPRRRPTTQWISVRRFHRDDPGTAVDEQLGAVGPGDPAGEVDHRVAVQRTCSGVAIVLHSWESTR